MLNKVLYSVLHVGSTDRIDEDNREMYMSIYMRYQVGRLVIYR